MATDSQRRPDRQDESWAWLEERYREHRRQLYRFALGVLGNKEDAEDATQITLLSAYDALARGKRPTWPRAWLFAIALNACRRVLRRRAQGAPVGDAAEVCALVDADDLTGSAISRAVASLPPEQREVFVLRELRGLSYAELSERLGLSPAAVESRLARARRRLRKQLVTPEQAPEGGPRRRRPVLGVADVLAALRAMPGPGAVKLAAVLGAGALAPVVVTALPGAPEGSARALSPVTAAAPATPRAGPSTVRVRKASRRLTPARAHKVRAADRSARQPTTAGTRLARPADVGLSAAGESSPPAPASEQPIVETQHVASSSPPPDKRRPTAESPTRPSPKDVSIPKPSVEAVVDQVAATAQQTADDVGTAVPVPQVPAPPVAVDAPDASSAVEDVVDTTSSTVSKALPGLG